MIPFKLQRALLRSWQLHGFEEPGIGKDLLLDLPAVAVPRAEKEVPAARLDVGKRFPADHAPVGDDADGTEPEVLL